MKYKLVILSLILLLQGCYKNIVEECDNVTTFNAFWDQFNKGYTGFEEKKIDWDSVYTVFSKEINNQTSGDELKQVFQHILDYINDLHVSIQYKENEYLTTSGKTIGKSVQRQLLYEHYFSRDFSDEGIFAGQLPGGIAYLVIPGFMSALSGDSVQSIISSINYKGGFIIDLRDNHGGYVSMMNELLSYFCPATFHAGFEKVKTGPGHNDFSDFRGIMIEGSELIPSEIQKVVLINENVFSAGNIFAAFIKEVPNTTVMGARSSGGGGYPVSTILPNNWILSFPRNKLYDQQHQYLDNGVIPDIIIDANKEHRNDPKSENGEDPVLEAAMEFLRSKRH